MMDFGRCCYKDEPGSYDAERIERNLIIIFAAGAAEEAYAGSPRHVGLDGGNTCYADLSDASGVTKGQLEEQAQTLKRLS